MIHFIINPTAGGQRGKKIKSTQSALEKVLLERNIDYNFHVSKSRQTTRELIATLISSGAKTLVAVGGDGTLHNVINGITDFDKIEFGLIPCGTGNDFASAAKIPLDPVKALDLILGGQAKYTDYMQMPTVRGINIIGMGIDVDVLKRYEKAKKKTKFAYTACLVKTLCNFKYIDFDAEIDGLARKHYTSFIACIANGNCYGGGIPICPPAIPTDKQLDFVAVDTIKRQKL